MILLREAPSVQSDGAVVVVFGAGLIGWSVASALRSLGDYEWAELPLSWSDPELQKLQLSRLEGELATPVGGSGTSGDGPAVSFFWSAGRAGFAASDAETEDEMSSFRRVLDLVRRTTGRLPRGRVSFGLTSSLGGLFEGQRSIDSLRRPEPRRPYGRLKLMQEELVTRLDPLCKTSVFRLSSVYGMAHRTARRGLVGTLLINGLLGRTTVIDACPTTLRDFVWVGDVAQHIANDLRQPETVQPSTEILASGRPRLILDVKAVVEEILGKTLLMVFSLDPANQEHITVKASALPTTWKPSPLETNARSMFQSILHRGIRSWVV